MLDIPRNFAYNGVNRRESVSKLCLSPIESRGGWKPGGRGRAQWAFEGNQNGKTQYVRRSDPPLEKVSVW